MGKWKYEPKIKYSYVELVTLLNQDVAPIILSMDERNIALMNGWKECQGARPQAQGTEKWVWLTHVMKYEFAYRTEISGLFKIRDNWAAEIRMNFCPNNPSHTHPMVCIISPEGIYLQPVLPQDDEEHTGEFGLCKNYKTIVKRFGVRDGKPNRDHPLLQFFGEGPLRIAGSLIDPPVQVGKVKPPTDWKTSKRFLSKQDIDKGDKDIYHRRFLQGKAMQEYCNRNRGVGYFESWKENQMNMCINIILSFERSMPPPIIPFAQDEKSTVRAREFERHEKQRCEEYHKSVSCQIEQWDTEKRKPEQEAQEAHAKRLQLAYSKVDRARLSDHRPPVTPVCPSPPQQGKDLFGNDSPKSE